MGPAGTSRLSPEGTREAKHTAGETAGVVVSGKHRLKCRLHNLEKNLSSTFLLPKVKKKPKNVFTPHNFPLSHGRVFCKQLQFR